MDGKLILFLSVISGSLASHFRGGTISWQPTGFENQVHMYRLILINQVVNLLIVFKSKLINF